MLLAQISLTLVIHLYHPLLLANLLTYILYLYQAVIDKLFVWFGLLGFMAYQPL